MRASDYNDNFNEKRIIEGLRKEYNLKDFKDVERLYNRIKSGEIKLVSDAGRQFDDEIYELYSNMKADYNDKHARPLLKDTRKSGRSTGKNEKCGEQKQAKPVKKLADYNPDMQKLIAAEMKKNEKKRRFVILLAVCILLVCVGYLIFYYAGSDRSQKRFDKLASLVGSDSLNNGEKTTVTAHLTSGETKELQVMDKYVTLYKTNNRLIGWIKIDDTNIDYPVMQCGDNEYYLNHNFDQKEDKAGALFLDCNCDVVNGSDNYIIYGHHLSSGKMFSKLGNYESESFYREHMYITFDTIYEEQTFQVMYAFRSRVYNDDDVVFKYYQFVDANSEEEFNSYMTEMANESFYDTGVQATYGDTLLTLSTCDYNETNGRFVVVAKRIK